MVLAVDGKKLSKVAEAKVGRWCQGAAWSRDGKTVLVQCMVEKEILALGFDGEDLKLIGGAQGEGRAGRYRNRSALRPAAPSRPWRQREVNAAAINLPPRALGPRR